MKFTNSQLVEILNNHFQNNPAGYKAFTDNEVVVVENSNGTKISTILIPICEERLITKDSSSSVVKVLLYNAGVWDEAKSIDSVKILTSNTLINVYGLVPFSHCSKEQWEIILNVLAILIGSVPQIKKYSYNGWGNDNKSFIGGTIKITQNGVEAIDSTIAQKKSSVSSLQKNLACQFFQDNVINICSEMFFGTTLITYYLLSLLKERFYKSHHFCPSFSLGVIGPTGSGKTSCVQAIANTFGIDSVCFEDSSAAIRRTFQTNSCGCTIVDDFKCNTNSNNQKLEEIIRLSGDITSGGKRVEGTKVNNVTITGMSLFTGEEYPKLQPSSYPRILFLEIVAGTIDFNKLTKLTDEFGIYVGLVVDFIQHIMNMESFENDFVEKVELKRKQGRELCQGLNMHARYYDMYAWLSATWEYLNAFLSENAFEYDYPKELITHIKNQHHKFDTEPVTLFARAFFELKDMNMLDIVDHQGMKEGCPFDVIELSNEYVVRSGEVYKKILAYLKEQGITFPISEKKLRAELYSKGILEKEGKFLVSEYKDKYNKSKTGYKLKKYLLQREGGYEYGI